MPVDPEGPKPVDRARLVEMIPAAGSLSTDQIKRFSSAVNIIPTPCEACGTLPIAHCVERGHLSSCAVLEKLLRRAIVLAQDDQPTGHIKAAINYPDLWFAEQGEGIPPRVTIYRDADGPMQDRVAATLQALNEEFGDQIDLRVYDTDVAPPADLGVRSRPTWFVNGHRFRGAQSARVLSRFIKFEILDAEK